MDYLLFDRDLQFIYHTSSTFIVYLSCIFYFFILLNNILGFLSILNSNFGTVSHIFYSSHYWHVLPYLSYHLLISIIESLFHVLYLFYLYNFAPMILSLIFSGFMHNLLIYLTIASLSAKILCSIL